MEETIVTYISARVALETSIARIFCRGNSQKVLSHGVAVSIDRTDGRGPNSKGAVHVPYEICHNQSE